MRNEYCADLIFDVSDECRLVSEVNLLGKLEEEASVLASVGAGDEIRVERMDV